MKLLIIGGTRFLGRALVHSAQARGHTITLFNRGKSSPGLFPEIEQIIGDRNTDLDLLRERHWDAVIDTCGFEPAVVRLSALKLAAAVERYVFISTISVYADFSQPGLDENAPVAQLPAGISEQFNIEYYGALKALCESAAETATPGRVLNIRPGLIVGEYDASDRFTYWPWRVAQGGDVLVPGRASHAIQWIDVRDLADWTLRMVESTAVGIYNATGPRTPASMGELLETCRSAARSDARLHWIRETFLLENGVQPWTDLPLWLAESNPDSAGMDHVKIDKALQSGLTFRTLEDTVQSTLRWAGSRPADHAWRAGISREKEAELLRKAGAIA